jgi:acyl-CoA synthetase (AMP-forming)/AMP-acid ligase II
VSGRPTIRRSPFPDPVVPRVSFDEYVLGRCARFGDRPALVDGATGASITYARLRAAVAEGAAALREAGAGPGATVALVAANQPAWVVALFGILAAGAAAVPLNPALTGRELERLLSLSKAALAVADDAGVAPARAAMEGRGEVLPLGELGGAGSPGARAPLRRADVHPRHAAVIASSSGTTGLPKGVVLSHRNLVATIVQHEGIYHVGPLDTVVAALPMFHIYGLAIVMGYALRHGATVVTMPRFTLDRYLQVIAEHGVTWLHLVPPVGLAMLSEEAAGAHLGSVRHAVSGAAPLDAATVRRLQARLGCLVGQGYGMTEASPGVTWVPDDGSVRCAPGSVGPLVPGTEARVVDPATGDDVNGEGELWIRGPQVMRGYLDAPAETAAALVDGRWLRTGDIMRVDPEGSWWVIDRLKELIKHKGYQVAPAELEAVLLEHPAVRDAAVAGAPDARAGEVPVAWVVTSAPVSEEELLGWVSERVAPYKRVRAVRVVDAIPRSPSGKVLRRELVRALAG